MSEMHSCPGESNERGGHVGPGYVPRLGEDVRATLTCKTSQESSRRKDPQI